MIFPLAPAPVTRSERQRGYANAARAAGNDVELLRASGADHFTLIDPHTEAWATAAARLERLLPAPARPEAH